MKSYHFDLGNSSKGPIGFCARIKAETEAEALDILKDKLAAMDDQIAVPTCDDDDQAIEYIEVYFGTDNITVKDIDQQEDA